MIVTEVDASASPATIHELLIDVDAWRVWSPHVASVSARERRVGPGWTGRTRAFFSPGATLMIVDDVRQDGGYTWHSTVGPWRLDYVNAVAPADQGSTLRFSAELRGPEAAFIIRLAALAHLVERHAD